MNYSNAAIQLRAIDSAEPSVSPDQAALDQSVAQEIEERFHHDFDGVDFTARTFLRIIKHIEIGWAVTTSCKAEGLSYRRFRQLCQRWPNYQARYEKAERQRADHRREAMEAVVLHHAIKNWQAAGWWLE
jgi:hypothetical protein